MLILSILGDWGKDVIFFLFLGSASGHLGHSVHWQVVTWDASVVVNVLGRAMYQHSYKAGLKQGTDFGSQDPVF